MASVLPSGLIASALMPALCAAKERIRAGAVGVVKESYATTSPAPGQPLPIGPVEGHGAHDAVLPATAAAQLPLRPGAAATLPDSHLLIVERRGQERPLRVKV